MIKKVLKTVLLATVGSVLSTICASAEILPGMDSAQFQPPPLVPIFSQTTAPTYGDMDALLGFRVLAGTGAGFEGIIDLGPVSQFNHTFTLSLGDIGGFMSTNFGSDWYTRMSSSQVGKTDIQWAVVATDNSTNFTSNLWSTRNPAVRSTPWSSSFNQDAGSNSVAAVGAQYANASNSIATGTTSAIKESASSSNSWTSYQPGGANSSGISFKTFNPTNEGNTNTVLPFDYVPAGSTNPGTTLGTFSWASNGNLTFTVVPEPSTYRLMALGGLGLLGLMILRRRRSVRV